MRSDRIVQASVGGAVVHLVATVVSVAKPDELGVVIAIVAGLLFVVGMAAFALTMVRVAGRSRREELSVGGIWFLTTAPTTIKRVLLAVLALEVVVGLAGAVIRPYTVLAFGVFAPIHGLGMSGLWAAEHATFPARRGR